MAAGARSAPRAAGRRSRASSRRAGRTRATSTAGKAASSPYAAVSPSAVPAEPPAAAVRVIRAGQGPTVASEQAPYAATLLSARPPGARRDIYHLRAEPGAARTSEPHIPGTVEHLIVSTGRVRAGPAGELVELEPGDCPTYRGDVPHSYEALLPGTTFVLVMQHV
ncbi:cupin domain-containing protein [Streptomyces antibioticus]|uniref:cupin domain-containing protein n=1 Tax=Streptomyces antibioticus TaxID=1890 RepID=UPI003F4CD121